MREDDEITGLLRSRLAGAEMTVREGFWEKLQEDVVSPAASRKKVAFLSPKYYRIAAAASVIFALGGVSAAFWFFSPKEEIKDAFTQVAALTPEDSLNGDIAQESSPSIHQVAPTGLKPGAQQPASGTPVGMTARSEEGNGSISVRFSITIRQRVQTDGDYFNNNAALQDGDPYQGADRQVDSAADAFSTVSAEGELDVPSLRKQQSRKWALRVALGTSPPKRNHSMPLTAGATVERSLSSWLVLETGIQYNCLHADRTPHTSGIPVKLNMTLASTPRVDLYAIVGGAAEKCIAGVPDSGFKAESVQLSVAAGVGAHYKLSDRFALFAESLVSRHFDTESETKTLRTERTTSLNLLCGVRMTYQP